MEKILKPKSQREAEVPFEQKQERFNGTSTDMPASELPSGYLSKNINGVCLGRFWEIRAGNKLYSNYKFTVTITDNTETLADALASGELYAANGDVEPRQYDVFKVGGTGDFTGNDLQTAKGGAPADGDFFALDTDNTLIYIPPNGALASPQADLPALRTGYSASKSGNTVTTTVGDDMLAADEKRYFVWGDGAVDEIVEFLTITTFKTRSSATRSACTQGWICGQINALDYHRPMRKIVLCIDTRIFVADYGVTKWTEVALLRVDTVQESVSQIDWMDNLAVIYNPGGIWKINLDEDIVTGWKSNTPVPAVQISDVLETELKIRARRYKYTMLKMRGGMHNDRGIEGGFIEQESGPDIANWDTKRDYGEVHTELPVGSGTETYGVLTGGDVATALWVFSRYDDASFKININGAGITPITCDFIGITTYTQMAARIQDGLRDHFYKAECTWEGTYFRVTSGKINGGTVSYITDATTGTNVAPFLMLKNGDARDLSNTRPYTQTVDIGTLTVPANPSDPTKYEVLWSHYGMYGTQDPTEADELTGEGVNPEFYSWIKDVPVSKAYRATRIALTGKITLVKGMAALEDISSTIKFLGGDEFVIRRYTNGLTYETCDYTVTIAAETINVSFQSGALFAANDNQVPSVDHRFIVQDNTDFTGGELTTAKGAAPAAGDIFSITVNTNGSEEISFISSHAANLTEDSAYLGCAAVFTASQSGNTATKTGGTRNYTADDIGKPFYWPDGTYSIVTAFVDVDNLTVHDSATRTSTAAGMDPTSRRFNDSIPDSTLETREADLQLKNRLWERLPECNCGKVVPGFMMTAIRGDNLVLYSQLMKDWKYLSGYYNARLHKADEIEDPIQAIELISETVVAYCDTSTWIGSLATSNKTKIEAIGITVSSFAGFERRYNNIGCMHWGGIQNIDDKKQLVITNEDGEPGMRTFDGYNYERDLLHDAQGNPLFKKEFTEIYPSFFSMFFNGVYECWGIEGI